MKLAVVLLSIIISGKSAPPLRAAVLTIQLGGLCMYAARCVVNRLVGVWIDKKYLPDCFL